MTSYMKKLLFFLLIAVCGCTSNSSHHGKTIEAVFHPGIMEDCSCVDFPKNFGTIPGITFEITSKDYNYITGVLCNNKMTTATDISDYKIVTKEVKPLCVFVKLDTIEYVLGANGVVKNGRKSFCISDLDMYHVKSILHYYDFFPEEDLDAFPEVRKYGIPANYHHHVLRKENAPPARFVRVTLKEK